MGWLKMQDVKMTDHQNCRAWNCSSWNWRTKNDDRAWNGMLNLYSVYSASNVRRLCALFCPAISFLHFHVLQFHVRHFHVQQFHALHIGPSISRPVFSTIDCSLMTFSTMGIKRVEKLSKSLIWNTVYVGLFHHNDEELTITVGL